MQPKLKVRTSSVRLRYFLSDSIHKIQLLSKNIDLDASQRIFRFYSDEDERPGSRAFTRSSSVVYERPSRTTGRTSSVVYERPTTRSVSSSRAYERPASRTSYSYEERPESRTAFSRSISYSSGGESPTRSRRRHRKVKLENYIMSDTSDFNIWNYHCWLHVQHIVPVHLCTLTSKHNVEKYYLQNTHCSLLR